MISTVPIPLVNGLIPDLPQDWKDKYAAIRNIGVVCLLFKLRKSVTPHFWVNIVSDDIDIPGIIEFSNLRPVGETIVYVPYYMPVTQPKWGWTDRQFIDEAFAYIKRINPNIGDDDLIDAKVGRLRHAQPICEPNFRDKLPPVQTPIGGLQIADTCYYYPEDRGVAESIRLGRRMAEDVSKRPSRSGCGERTGLMMYDAVMQWLPAAGDLGVNSSMMLSLIFFAASFVLIPRTFLCLGAGASFGLGAVLVILPSTMLGGILAFLSARYFFSERVHAYVDARPRLRRFATAVDEEGWRVVALLRFASPMPNAVQNYVFGLTRIGFWPFAVTTFVFSIPQVVLYVYLGSAGRAVLLDESLSTLNRVLLGIGLVSILVAALLVVRRVRRDADRAGMEAR